MVVLPIVSVETTPKLLIVAVPVLEEVQMTVLVRFSVLPSL
jgi:hypothetical protein